MTFTNEDAVTAAVEAARAVHTPPAGGSLGDKPRLQVQNASPDRTVSDLRGILAERGGLFERVFPVRLTFDQLQGGACAKVMTADAVVLLVHSVSRPWSLKERRDGSVVEVDVRLPRPFAVMYLDWWGEWRLPPLNGIASAPLLYDDGSICSKPGYDRASGLWLENVPDLTGLIPEWPSREDAAAALLTIREAFKTFCFADAVTRSDAAVPQVDISRPPGRDESAFLTGLLTAVCRPSLYLAPGPLVRAAALSGAGAGKGLLARCICLIAFGREPHAVTGGGTAAEMEKRIAAELIEGGSVLFLDNMNNIALKSDLLASVLTERPTRVRLLGRSQMVPLNSTALVVVTGNGLTVSEDLARRFLTVELDPRTEDPEARPFTSNIRLEVKQRRKELLAALLTIWRWGRLNADVSHGRALGSFEQWCRWVRDPLLALGCPDPVERISEAKLDDGERQAAAELFEIWWEHHRDKPVTIKKLREAVRQVVDPQGRGRQYISGVLVGHTRTRAAGFVLTRQASPSKWGAATYALKITDEAETHRDHRDHRAEEGAPNLSDAPYARPDCREDGLAESERGAPMTPMVPMPSPISRDSLPDDDEAPGWRMRL